MRKIRCLFVLCILCIHMHAQNMFSYSVELEGGIGFGRGPLFSITPQFVAQYNTDNCFIIGAGTGTRFALPCLQYKIKDDTHKREFCNELDIPVFVRLGYGNEKIRAIIDAGYAIGILSMYSFDWHPSGRIGSHYSGFFIEPQVGWTKENKKTFTLGLILQQSTVMDKKTIEVRTSSSSLPDEIRVESHTRIIITPAITFRYGFNL